MLSDVLREHIARAAHCRFAPSHIVWFEDDSCRAEYLLFADAILALLDAARAESQSELLEVLKEAISTLAASRHLIGKYVPDHSWLPEHDKRIAGLKSAISRAEGLGVEGGGS